MIASEETRAWVFDVAAWWLESFGGFETFAGRTSMVLPTEDDLRVVRESPATIEWPWGPLSG